MQLLFCVLFGAGSVLAGGFSLFAEDVSDARNEISVRVYVPPESERSQHRTYMTLYEDRLSR